MEKELHRTWNAITLRARKIGLRRVETWDHYYAKVVEQAEIVIKATPTEAAYLAGLFDGEGYVSIVFYKKKKGKLMLATPKLGLSNSNREVLEWAMKLLSSGRIWQAYKAPYQKDWLPVYCWAVEGYRCVPVARLILPYLRIKEEKAKLLLSFYQSRRLHAGKPYTEEEWEIARKIRSLNRRGKLAHFEHFAK